MEGYSVNTVTLFRRSRAAAWVLENVNGGDSDVRDGDLSEPPRRRERCGVDALRELLD